MNTNTKWYRLFSFAIILLLLTAALWPVPALLIRERQGDIGLIVPLLSDKEFDYEYIHSVQKTPVQEHFVAAPDNQLKLISTTYQSFGVGLPYLPEEGELTLIDGKYVLTGIDRSFEVVHMGVWPPVKQALQIHGKRYVLADYFASGTMLDIEITEISPLNIIWINLRGALCER